jgi:TRAP-type C4-dicarboxylate transport system permease small subunit
MEAPETRLDRINARATLWLARAGAVCLAAMTLLTFVDVVGRFIRKPILGGTEMTAILMGALVFFTFGHTTVKRGHLRADFIFSRLPAQVRAVLDIVTHTLAVALAMLISWQLFVIAGRYRESGQFTQSLGWVIWPDAYVMAFASLFLVTSLVLQVAANIRMLVSGERKAETPVKDETGSIL